MLKENQPPMAEMVCALDGILLFYFKRKRDGGSGLKKVDLANAMTMG